ncbi:Hypothetical protein NTJ_02596 [Nesidiocoris tenuis]|uniref:Uncharacterized protein n=1 Tax=Nesidiocoris tenuis TaxID=355587 RepID=A0ABN7AF53_9HEMI|nr:Hypothetical protein NTJ_02596 [Nesidiocoris tenuis]
MEQRLSKEPKRLPPAYAPVETVMFQAYSGPTPWLKGKISERLGELHYEVIHGVTKHKRHVDQIKPCVEPANTQIVRQLVRFAPVLAREEPPTPKLIDQQQQPVSMPSSPPRLAPTPSAEHPTSPSGRPARDRQPPRRYTPSYYY